MAFLHGAEVLEVANGARPITAVRSGVIGLVGTAPIGPTNAITVITSARAAVETFGQQVPGFTIPKALDSIFAQGSARVLVINVFDVDDHTTTVTDEDVTVAAGTFTLDEAPVTVPVVTSSDGATTYVLGEDYEYNAFGVFRILDTVAIPDTTALKVDYKHLDATTIVAAVINGSASAPRTGLELFDEALATLNYVPKILIAPTYSADAAVSAKMLTKAASYRGVALIDSASTKTLANIIAGRGSTGGVPGFQTSDKRAILLYPYVSAVNQLGVTEARPYSPYLAGVMAVTDNAEGYWVSPSNHEIKGIVGMNTQLSAGLSDTGSDVNQLNEVGVVTIFTGYGTGFRVWGNRNAGYPVDTAPDVFIPVQRVKDLLNDSVERAMLPYIDRPINQALIDTIRESVNAFMRTLVQRGAILDGECTYDPTQNPASELALGHLTFDISFMPPTPAERITFKSYLDVSILEALFA